jgi:5-methylcytosine-specific restriction endonuclease McrA
VLKGTCSTDGCDGPIRCRGLCNRHYQQQWRDEHREQTRRSIASSKQLHADRVKSSAQRYWTENGDRLRAASRDRYRADPEKFRERNAAYRAANPEKRRAAVASWAQRNADHRRAVASAYLAEHPKVRVLKEGRRRAAKRANGTYRVTSADVERLLHRFDHRCAYCGARGQTLHIDHVVPICRGGAHTIGNLLPACAKCNLRKGRLTLTEWRARDRA